MDSLKIERQHEKFPKEEQLRAKLKKFKLEIADDLNNKGKWPDFLGIGFDKTGTTWLHAMLAEHPELGMAVNPDGAGRGKEFNYWSGSFLKGTNAYREIVSQTEGKYIGEFSTSYMAPLEVLSLIKDYCPEIKLICGFREPVSRLNSAYNHMLRSSWHLESPDKFLTDYVLQYSPSSVNYDDTYVFLKDNFPNNVYFYFYEDLVSNPIKVVSEIYKFLEVDSSFIPTCHQKKFNVAYTYRNRKIHAKIIGILVKLYGENNAKRMLAYPKERTLISSMLLNLNKAKKGSLDRYEEKLRSLLKPLCTRVASDFDKEVKWKFKSN